MKTAQIVIGAGYGDEGKGKMVDYLAAQAAYMGAKTLVVRGDGGSQAAHHVIHTTGSHCFQHIGSGTFSGCHTYLAPNFLVNPATFNIEYIKLIRNHNVTALVFVFGGCRVTTPYDVLANWTIEKSRGNDRHGSCGLGIYETILRSSQKPLFWIDLVKANKEEVKDILSEIHRYYIDRFSTLNIEMSAEMSKLWSLSISDSFFYDISLMKNRTKIVSKVSEYELFNQYAHFIFEGNQGLLLSQEYGVMPYCTPSDPRSNAHMEICLRNHIYNIGIIYVTRAYTTRHGNGPLEDETTTANLGLDTAGEFNIYGEYQGQFRYAPLDINNISRAILSDRLTAIEHRKKLDILNFKLALTCLDQMPFNSYIYDKSQADFVSWVFSCLNMNDGYLSYGPGRDLTKSY